MDSALPPHPETRVQRQRRRYPPLAASRRCCRAGRLLLGVVEVRCFHHASSAPEVVFRRCCRHGLSNRQVAALRQLAAAHCRPQSLLDAACRRGLGARRRGACDQQRPCLRRTESLPARAMPKKRRTLRDASTPPPARRTSRDSSLVGKRNHRRGWVGWRSAFFSTTPRS